jgi:hypothetical protein
VETVKAHANQGEVSTSQYLKQLQQCNSMSQVFKLCAHAHGAGQSSEFFTIDVPKDPTTSPKDCMEWQPLDCPQSIEKALLKKKADGQTDVMRQV